MPSVIVLPKMNKIKKNGEAPLYMRIIKNRKPKYISLGFSIRPELWDEKRQVVKRGHPNSARLNSLLCHKITEARDILIDTEIKNKHLSSTKIKEKIIGNGDTDFVVYFQSYVDVLNLEKKIATHKKAKAILAKLTTYLKGRSLAFADIDVSWLKKYESYLKVELGNAQNTVHSALKMKRKLFNDAINEDIVSKEVYPFDKYKLKWEKNEKVDYLQEDEVTRIREVNLEKGSIQDISRNIFVFSCYSGGLRISDLLQLTWENYDGSHINFTSAKTHENLSIKLPIIGREILNIYKVDDNSTKFIFPILDKYDTQTAQNKHDALSRATALINKSLKIISRKADLKNKHLSSHWARRTFTCMALAKGMNLDVASKILGHGGQTVTLESYARYSQKDLHKAMDVFD